jgi:O-antigen/teichoic acid export membrane protein
MQSNEPNSSLKNIGKGTMIYLVGTVVSILFGFVSKSLIARYGTETQFGIYSLALVIINVALLFSCLGLVEGTTRYIAYFRGKGEKDNATLIGSMSLLTVTILGAILCVILFFTSDVIATKIFKEPDLIPALKILAFCIPLISNLNVFIAIFRGFDRAQEKVYFQDISINVVFCFLMLPIFFLKINFIWVFFAYLITIAVTVFFVIIYTKRNAPAVLHLNFKINSSYKALLRFSLPLVVVSMFQMILAYSDTVLLGYFQNAGVVGLYNAALPVCQFIMISMSALVFTYAPIIAGLYAQNLLAELAQNYVTITKWIFVTSFPMLLFILFFSKQILMYLWGANYVSASLALQILAVGVFISNLLGPNGTTLMIIGQTMFLTWASLAAVVLNVVLDLVLIPKWGIEGASIATTIALILHCLIRHIRLRGYIKVSPLKRNLFFPAAVTLVLVAAISLFVLHYFEISLWLIILLFFIFYGIYFTALKISKSLDHYDIMMLNEIGSKIPFLRKKLKRFP